MLSHMVRFKFIFDTSHVSDTFLRTSSWAPNTGNVPTANWAIFMSVDSVKQISRSKYPNSVVKICPACSIPTTSVFLSRALARIVEDDIARYKEDRNG